MNNNQRIFLGTFTGVVILTIPLFLLERSGILLTAYVFGLAGVFSLSWGLFRTLNRNGGEYVTNAAFPLAAVRYLILELIFSAVVIILHKLQIFTLPAGWFLFAHSGLAGLFFWKLLAMDSGREEIERIGHRTDQQTSFWKSLAVEVNTILLAADEQKREHIAAVYEAIRYADPVSRSESAGLELQIQAKIAQLSAETGEVSPLCQEIIRMVRQRNEIIKLSK